MFDPNESAQASSPPSNPAPDLSLHERHPIASVPNFQFAVEHQVEGVALLDAEGLYRYVNPAHARLFDYTPDEMLGRSWKMLYSPAWQRALEQQFPALLASGVWRGEAVAQRKDGSAFDQDVALCVIRDAQGQTTGFVCTCRDISDQTWAQKTAREQDRQFRTLFDLAPIGIAKLNLQGRFQRANPWLLQLLGYTEAEALASTFQALTHPDDLRDNLAFVQELLAGTRNSFTMDKRYRRKDGDYVWVSLSLALVRGQEGNPLNFVAVVQSLQDRRKVEQALRASEEKLRQSLQASNTGLWDWNTETGEVRFSKEWKSQLGYGEEELPDAFETWESRLHPDDHDRAVAYAQTYRANPVGAFRQDFRLRHRDGAYRWIDSHASFITEPDGRRIRLLGAHTDVTDRKQAEDLLRETNIALSHAMPGIARLGSDGRYLYVNDAYAQTLGHRPEALLGQSWEMTVHPDDRAMVAAAYERMKQEGKVEVEARGLRADGSTFYKLVLMVQGHTTGASPVGHHCFMRDITERKRQELERTSHLRQLQALYDLTGALIGSDGLPRLYEIAMHSIRNALGVDRVSILLFDSDEVLRFKASYGLSDQYRRAVEGHSPWEKGTEAPQPICIADVRLDPSLESYRPIFDAEGIVALGFIPLVHDHELLGKFMLYYNGPHDFTPEEIRLAQGIADHLAIALRQQLVQQALSDSEERYRALFHDTPSILLAIHPNGTVLSINQFGADHLGYGGDDIIGRPLVDLLQAEDHATVGRMIEDSFAQPFQMHHGEFRMRHRNGDPLWARASLRIAPMPSGLPYALLTCQDITAHKKLEEENARSQDLVASMLEHLPHMVFVKDAESLRFVHLNRGAEELLGRSRTELIGKSDYDCVPKEQADAFIAKERNVLSQKRLVDIPEEPIDSLTKGRRTLHTKKIPILDHSGQPRFLLSISEDITEYKLLEQRLRQAEKMEAMGTLAGGIAHDFNNILAAMIGYTELSRDGVAPGSRTQQNLDQVLIAGRRAKSLIQQILAFSRRREPQREVLDLRRLIEEAFSLLRASIPTTIAMEVDLPPLAAMVLADPTQLQQVLINLSSNAAQAMTATGGALTIRLEEWDVPASFAAANPPLSVGPHLRIMVRDTGVGMSAEVLSRIFDPFFTTKKVGEGTGLGLSAALGIVTSHGGTMTVQSEAGRGSTFCVYLPKLAQADGATAPGTAPVVGGSERILFVDDEVALVRLAEQMLGNLGYRVTAVTDPVLALGRFRNTPDDFDLIITDQTMPGMSGESLAEEILRLRPSVPIVLCTGFSQSLTDDSVKELGIRGLLVKPLTIPEMAAAIRTALTPAQ